MDKIENRLKAINTLHEWINDVTPKILADIKVYGYKVKSDQETLFEKDRKRLNAIIEDKPPRVRAYFTYSQYSGLQLRSDISYQASAPDKNGVTTVNYYDRMFWLDSKSPSDKLEIYNIQEWIEKDKAAIQMEEQGNKLLSDARSIQYITRGR